MSYTAGRSDGLPVTRPSAAALITGSTAYQAGLLQGSSYAPYPAPNPLYTLRADELLSATSDAPGTLLTAAPTLGEHLRTSRRRLVVINTVGSAIGAILSRNDGSIAVELGEDGGAPLARPEAVRHALLRRFGDVPTAPEGAAHPTTIRRIEWAVRALVDYIIPELEPDVVLLWCSEPDDIQHRFGVGSPQALAVLERLDETLGELWEVLRPLRARRGLNVIVTADHGFSALNSSLSIADELISNGLKDAPDSKDVEVAVAGLALLRVRDERRLADILEWAWSQPWVGGILTAATLAAAIGDLGTHNGGQAAHVSEPPNLVLAPAWTSHANEFGAKGRSALYAADVSSAAAKHSGHGALSPYDLHVPLVLWGSDFRSGARADVPAAVADIAPTVLTLAGLPDKALHMNGRVLYEALREAPREQPPVESHVIKVKAGPSTMTLDTSIVGSRRYLNTAWRC